MKLFIEIVNDSYIYFILQMTRLSNKKTQVIVIVSLTV